MDLGRERVGLHFRSLQHFLKSNRRPSKYSALSLSVFVSGRGRSHGLVGAFVVRNVASQRSFEIADDLPIGGGHSLSLWLSVMKRGRIPGKELLASRLVSTDSAT
jgi:hypothetical protein